MDESINEEIYSDDDSSNKNNYTNQSIIKNGIINIIYHILAVIAPLITAPYVARVLLPDGVGVYSYTHSLVTYFTLIAGLGTLSYGTREISRKRQNKIEYSKAFWEIELLTVIMSLISLIIWFIFSFLYAEYRILLIVCSFYILGTLLDISWFYTGLEKIKYIVLINSLCKIIGVVLIFLLVKTSDDLLIYIMLNAIIVAAGNLSMWFFLPFHITKTEINISGMKHHFKETLVYFIPTIATTIYTILDKTILGIMCSDKTLSGYYEQGTKILNISKTVSFIGIIGVVSPRISFLYKINDLEKIKSIAKNTLNVVLFFSIAVCVGVISISDIFVPMFFGEGYDMVVVVLYMMMPLCIIISISSFLGGLYYTPIGKRKQSTIYLIIGSLINLVLNFTLIPFFNIYGAIISTLIAESVITILYFIFCRKFICIQDIFSAIWKKLIAAGVMFLSIFFLKKLNFNIFYEELYNLLFENIVMIFAGGVIYLITCILLKDRTFEILRKKLKN